MPVIGSQSPLILTVSPVGGYATYTLVIDDLNIDPLFRAVDFKFRPGCFNINCRRRPEAPAQKSDPVIDYLARDFDTFKHTLITAMKKRVPGWEPTSEADLDMVLIELLSATADELSDYQDRVMNEAFLSTARKRVSIARHARLMDYHIHQGNQASTVLAIKVFDDVVFPEPRTSGEPDQYLTVWTENGPQNTFVAKEEQYIYKSLNYLEPYTWDGTVMMLKSGSTSADLIVDGVAEGLIIGGKVPRLLIQEWLDPSDGSPRGANPVKRQMLHLITEGDKKPVKINDPLTGMNALRVHWAEEDRLNADYYFARSGRASNPVFPESDMATLFHGNLVDVYHGAMACRMFKEPGQPLADGELYYERIERNGGLKGTVCRLPDGPLAYEYTPQGGDRWPKSTLEVRVDTDDWSEAISLIQSDGSTEGGSHFVVETDEEGRSLIRFGDGINGRALPGGAEVECYYQAGRGIDGNVGADSLVVIDRSTGDYGKIDRCWNPFDVINGRDPEPAEEIVRKVPEAYRHRQLRAVTLQDYRNRAGEVAGVSSASACYVWTGSWRGVRITIDPAGTDEPGEELMARVREHLEAVRLIGEDIEIRPPKYIPLKIDVSICVRPGYWPEDIKTTLEQEFADERTPDGRPGFFHPDRWTFGQELNPSQIIGRVQSVEGIDHVLSIGISRWDGVPVEGDGVVKVGPAEIIQVRNDPDQAEHGYIFFKVYGGG